ncbi:hypothetical protein J6590_004860 [Homalodisca vitripennis]|nr:hypothetical protein J6590_004860 [Homalodisca vitripennis]
MERNQKYRDIEVCQTLKNTKRCIYRQNAAPSHFNIDVQNWLNDNYPTWISTEDPITWPTRSPDLNPMDFLCTVRGLYLVCGRSGSLTDEYHSPICLEYLYTALYRTWHAGNLLARHMPLAAIGSCRIPRIADVADVHDHELQFLYSEIIGFGVENTVSPSITNKNRQRSENACTYFTVIMLEEMVNKGAIAPNSGIQNPSDYEE